MIDNHLIFPTRDSPTGIPYQRDCSQQTSRQTNSVSAVDMVLLNSTTGTSTDIQSDSAISPDRVLIWHCSRFNFHTIEKWKDSSIFITQQGSSLLITQGWYDFHIYGGFTEPSVVRVCLKNEHLTCGSRRFYRRSLTGSASFWNGSIFTNYCTS